MLKFPSLLPCGSSWFLQCLASLRSLHSVLLRFMLALGILLSCLALPAYTATLSLAWDASTSSTVTGYRLYQGTTSRTYTANTDVGNQTSYAVSNLTAGQTYYFAATAYDAGGQESGYSNEVSYTVPSAPPTAPPTANFSATATSGTAPLAVTFTDTSTGSITGWAWTFGDNTTSSSQNPSHTYTAAGTYTVQLTVSGPGGTSSPASQSITVSTPPGGGGVSSGLVAAYSFEDGSGTTLTDVSGNGNHGTISGATWSTQGHSGQALSFNGSSNWVTIADASSLDLSSGMTLEAWVNPTALTGWRTVILKQQPNQLAYALYANTGSNTPSSEVFIGTANNKAQGSATLPLNAWSHLAATYDGTRLRLYVNGTLAKSLAVTGLIQTSTNPLRLGGNSIWGEYFAGRMDDVRIYNRALAAAEIQADMQAPVSTATTTAAASAAVTSLSATPLTGTASLSATASQTGGSTTATMTNAVTVAPAAIEAGEIDVNQVWTPVTLRQTFGSPIVVAQALSRHSVTPATVRIRHVTPAGFEIRVEEWDYQNGRHATETIGYLVLEQGRHSIDGVQVEAGSIQQQGTTFGTVAFASAFPVVPVVLTAVVTTNEVTTVTTQVQSIGTANFQVRMQEQAANAQTHAEETLHYVAWAPSVGLYNGLHFAVQRTPQVMTDTLRSIQFTTPFMSMPVFLAATQTTADAEPTVVRWENLDLLGVDVQLQEEQSQDTALGHAPEIVGYFAFAPTVSTVENSP